VESDIQISRTGKACLSKALDLLSENLADEGRIAFKGSHPSLIKRKAVTVPDGEPCDSFGPLSGAGVSSGLPFNIDRLDDNKDVRDVPLRPDQDLSANKLISELRYFVAKAINSLQEMERMVITLYYYEELTLKEIAGVLGVPESQASKLHTQAIMGLTNTFKREGYFATVN
jgi:RNA polymerase sigma factor (sigma-70 family)